MRISTHIDAIEEHGAALGAAAGRAGLAADVPSCPAWTVRELVSHTGQVHRWAAGHVRESRANAPKGFGPAPEEGLLEWYDQGWRELVAALRAAPPDLDAFTFLRSDSPLAFWARRQAHETAIHRADADAATGVVAAYDPELAADGIDELICGLYGRRGGTLFSPEPRSLRVSPADADGTWRIEIGPDSRTISVGGTEPADCVLTGPAADLYLFLWNREPAGQPSVTGDPAVLDLWRERARVLWR
jgi:uncharacterized protein (TIGR03083 family)